MQIVRPIFLLVLASLFLTACDDSRRTSARMDLTISGAFEKRVSGRANAGYAATDAGSGYSFAISWPEDSAGRGPVAMSARNTSPLFVWNSPRQPAQGVYQVTTLERGIGHPGKIVALLAGPHNDTAWESDSGTVAIVKSRDESLTLVGTFDIWLTCNQACPCQDKPCQVRVQGSMTSP